VNKINWTAVGVFGVLVLLAFLVGVSLLGGRGYGGWGMMGPGMMGGWGYNPLGWIGMILMWLIPIGVIVLVVAGVVWLARTIGAGSTRVAPTRSCPSCGRGVQADWRHCPFCGSALASV
jgi:uncharacterized membrane protein